MTEFSVGDRVLVPGKVTKTGEWLRPGEVKVGLGDGYVAWIDPDDLRPDTGGRDLTAEDIRDAHHASFGIPSETFKEFIAERLNRIARGDAGSAGDDTAPPADEKCALCGHVPACGYAHTIATTRRRLCHDDDHSCFTRWTRDGERPAAGPRAGDTAPADRRTDVFLSYLDVMVNNDDLDSDVRATIDEAQATIRRLRSDAAALRDDNAELRVENKHLAIRWQEMRAAGNELATDVERVVYDAATASPGDLAALVNALSRDLHSWRSAAGGEA